MNSNFHYKEKQGAAVGGSFFSIRLEQAKNGKDIFIINDRYVHSKFSPEKECSGLKFPSKSLIVHFGLGVGYQIRNIMEANPDSYCLVFEPFSQIYEVHKEYLGDLLSQKLLIINRLDDERIFPWIQKILSSEFLRMQHFSNSCYKMLLPEEEKRYFEWIKKIFEISVQNVLTEAHFIPLWYKNIFYHLVYTKCVPLLDLGRKSWGENVAVICGAGPTLDRSIQFLRNHREKITVFATDTAVMPLLEADVVPDFIVSLDGQFYSLGDFLCKIPDECGVILDFLSYPGIVEVVKCSYLSVTKSIDNGLIPFLFDFFQWKKTAMIETGGTVTDYTVDVVVKLGFQHVLLMGYDLSFPGLVTHCKGAPSHKGILSRNDYWRSPEGMMLETLSQRNLLEMISIEGGTVFSDFVMKNYQSYMESYIAYYKNVAFYSFSNLACKVAGIRYLSLAAGEGIVQQSTRVQKEKLLSNSKKIYLREEELAHLFSILLEDFYGCSQQLKERMEKIREWKCFSEEIFSLKEVIFKYLEKYPFMKQFLIMTEILLDRNQIGEKDPAYYKHVSFKLLQSIYYMIRIFQKSKRMLEKGI